jgi:Tol biopolymer transport system component
MQRTRRSSRFTRARPLSKVDLRGLDVEAVSSGPDGALLVVAREGGSTKIVKVDKEWGAPTVLVSGDVANIPPALSPDRAYLAFGRSARPTGAGVLGYSSIEGRSDAELMNVANYTLRGVSFHPSGRWIVFASDRDSAGFELYALQLPDTLAVTSRSKPAEARTVRLTFAQGDAPAFSPDGTSVAFGSRRRGPTQDLYVARFAEDP